MKCNSWGVSACPLNQHIDKESSSPLLLRKPIHFLLRQGMSGVSPCGWSACCGNRPLPLLCRGPWCMCHGFSLGFRKTSHNRKIQDEFEDVVLRCPKIFEEKNSTQLLNDLKIPNGPFWDEDVSFLTFFVQGKKGRYSKKSAHRLEHHHQHTMAFLFSKPMKVILSMLGCIAQVFGCTQRGQVATCSVVLQRAKYFNEAIKSGF